MSHLADGLIRAVAPVAAHLAEDAWQNLPFQSSAASVFQAGWQGPQADWSSLSEQDQADCRALLAVRAETNQVLRSGSGLMSMHCSFARTRFQNGWHAAADALLLKSF